MKASIIAALVAASMVCGASAASKNYLRFTARGGAVTIGMVDPCADIDWEEELGYVPDEEEMEWYLTPPLTLETAASPDQADWSLFEAGTDQIVLADGETVYFRQHDPNRTDFQNAELGGAWHFTMSADPSTPQATVEAGGNALSVVDATCGEAELAPYAISELFRDCTILTTPPELHAAKLATRCYQWTFWGCTGLRTPPALPAMELAEACYLGLFDDCTSLEYAPALPATNLVRYCYRAMFNGCSALTAAPELPATRMADSCYSMMFYKCASLTTAPELPVAELANSCFDTMFGYCSSITSAPELPLTTLANGCYQYMFEHCTSLTTAPELPATVLTKGCYSGMFEDCTSLTVAPRLPATELTDYCYLSLFSGCTSLKRVSVAFTAWKTTASQTKSWMNEVPASGLFICHASLAKTYGDGYIPFDWTVAEPVAVKVPRQANCTAVATADGAAITGTPDGDAAAFVFGKGKEDADITFEPSEGYALVGAAEYTIPKIAAPVTFGTGDYALPTVVRLAPEVSCQSAALQFDGLAVEGGAVSLSFGVRTTAALDVPDWQPATVTGAAVSPDGKTVTLTIPATAAQAFYRLAEK